MMGFLRSSEELKVFDTNEVIEFFNKLVSSFDFDVEIGKGETMKYILALKDQPRELLSWPYVLVLPLRKVTVTSIRTRNWPPARSLSRWASTRLNLASDPHPARVKYGFHTHRLPD